MTIRQAEQKDIKNLIQLGNKIKEFETSQETVVFWPESVLEKCIASQHNPIFVAEENEQIVGFLIYNYNPLFKKAIIENIYVKSGVRNKGIGSKLLQAAKSKLQNDGCEYICTLTGTGKGNKAVNFYLKEGFNRGVDCAWLDTALTNSFKRK